MVTITISEKKNPYFYLFNNKLLIEKDEENSYFKENIVFASPDIENASIPSSNTGNYPYSFSFVNNIKKNDFLIDSSLISINNHSYYKSSIESIFIAKSVKIIDEFAFSECSNLKSIEFQ